VAEGEEGIRIDTGHGEVSGVWAAPRAASAFVVVAHGAGSGMDSPALVGFTRCLNEAGIGSLRFNVPYMEAGKKTPDRQPVTIAAWNAAAEEVRSRSGGKRVFASGKSFGGRMASMAVAEGMPAAGLIFLGYPLHAPGKTDQLRDEHLGKIHVPMLFLQGTQDPFARFDLIQEVTHRLGRWAVLHPVQGGDHSFRVRGRKMPDETIGRLLGSVAARFIQSAQI
jgi:predicted alpha/beta-hydrolase family hydrolase